MLVCFFSAQTFVIPIYKGNNRNYQKARVKCPPTAYQHHHGWTDSLLCKFLSDLCDLLAKRGEIGTFFWNTPVKVCGNRVWDEKKCLQNVSKCFYRDILESFPPSEAKPLYIEVSFFQNLIIEEERQKWGKNVWFFFCQTF